MKKLIETTCILCPNGCDVTLYDDDEVRGNRCDKGRDFAIDEFKAPKRMVTSTVRTLFEKQPRLSVKTTEPVPKEKVLDVMNAINGVTVDQRLRRGDVLIEDVCGLHVDIVATGCIWEEV